MSLKNNVLSESDTSKKMPHYRHSRTGSTKPRLYKFPPLRKPWQAAPTLTEPTPAEYQKQLMEGFQEGVNQGFNKGVEQGKEERYPEGVRLGFDEGMKKGIAEGTQVAKSQFLDAAQPLSAMVKALRDYLDDYEVRRRDELVQLVEKVTHQVIRCELALQPTQLLALVEEALTGLPAVPKQLRVYLNPEEFARINDVEPEKVVEWGLTASSQMEAGECRVVTETTEMDVGCQHRLDQCVEALKTSLLAGKCP